MNPHGEHCSALVRFKTLHFVAAKFEFKVLKRIGTTLGVQNLTEELVGVPYYSERVILKLEMLEVRDVNRQRDENGLTYAGKAMIRSGMALIVNGKWEEKLLFPRLQAIIEKHLHQFEGQS